MVGQLGKLIIGTHLILFFTLVADGQEKLRARDYGVKIGILPPGLLNAITDVQGVRVGHTTLHKGDHVHTGVTAILPHDGNIFQLKVPAALYVGNGFGKIAGTTQIEELGQIETPILLTNTLNVSTAVDALIEYTLSQAQNEDVKSVNAVVGETNDGRLNDIRGQHLNKRHMLQAIQQAKGGPVAEGSIGAGTGTVCFGYKGGIGTASRAIPKSLGGYTVGVLVQANFGGILEIDGVPVAQELGKFPYKRDIEDADGSCMIVVATDAPLNTRNLKRLAQRAMLGLARTGGFASNGSGDYVIAFSVYADNLESYRPFKPIQLKREVNNDFMSPLFLASVEATEEAIINALFKATTYTGFQGAKALELPIAKVLPIMRKYSRLNK